MPQVRFVADFDWRPRRQITIAYKVGHECSVTTPCAEAAIAAGFAEYLKEPINERRKVKREPDVSAS